MNLAPSNYSSAYGGTPNLPTSGDITSLLKQNLNGVIPGFDNLTKTASTNIGNQLNGQLPSDVLSNIKDASAAWGVNSGMPGSGIQGSNALKLVGQNTLSMNQAGQNNFLNLLQGISGTATPNAGQTTDLTSGQALYNSAPNPQDAANALLALYQKYQTNQSPASGRNSFTISPASGGFGSNMMGGLYNSSSGTDLFSQSNNASYQNYLNNVNRTFNSNPYAGAFSM